MSVRPPIGVTALGLALGLGWTALSAAPATLIPTVDPVGGFTPLQWSVQMAKSEMARRGTKSDFVEGGRASWEYTMGLLAYSLEQLGGQTGDAEIRGYGERLVGSFIAPDGTIRTYRADEYNIDMIPPGRVVLALYERTKEERFRRAAALLRGQLATHPRTSEGGFWHKNRYPDQMWLDGLYMGSPFLAQYGKTFNEPAAFDDVAKQIILMDRHGYDPKTGLFYHAWDEKRVQAWANKKTGQSPNFWGRAVGWYGMAIVDSLDDLPPTLDRELAAIHDILTRWADGVVRWQDPQSGVWYQVLDQGARAGNYLEATASSMFVYTLAKAINRGYLPREKYLSAVQRGYAGLICEFVRVDAGGRVNLTRCCEVAGLGFTSSTGRPRDGSFEYYVSEPIVDNDLKGIGPFILAGAEMQRLLANAAQPAATIARGWSDAEVILARIKAPTFPARDFPIVDFGAVAGGADCTGAIRKAIAACHAAGGGRVVVPAGEWHTGAIHLLSNVNLHVAEGATLKFTFDTALYPMVNTRWEGVECRNYSPLIYAWEQANIAVTGKGTLDGGASPETWWAWNDKAAGGPPKQKAARDRLNQLGESGVPVDQRIFGDGSFLRPNFIQPYRCTNVLIEGVKIVSSPMWEVHPVLCTNLTVRGVSIVSHGPNNDGCDPESCRDVLIENCTFETGDDCIAIKSGRNNDGRRIGVPSENFVIRNCTMKDGHGGVVIGSEISGGCRNVFVENCTMDSPNLDRAFRFKTNASRGGTIESFFARQVRVGRVAEAVLTIDLLYEEGAKGEFPPTVRNIAIEHVTSTSSPRVMFIRGVPGATVDGIRFSDCAFSGVEMTEVLSGAGTVTFRNVSIEPLREARSLNSPTAP